MILKIFKEKTANLHLEVEQLNDAGFIMDHSISLEIYKNLLQQNLRAYSAIEKFINEHAVLLPLDLKTFVSMQKSIAIRKDLIQITTEDEFNEIVLNDKPSQMQLIGMLYVIEGSMLGGMMIGKHLSQCDALTKVTQHHFFGGDNKAHVARWKSFCASVEADDYTEDDINEAVKGAHTAFETFKQAYTTPVIAM